MTAFGPWTLEEDGPVAVLTIDKPPLNLFDEEVFGGMIDALARVARERPRGLLIRAEGKVWTGGVDVHMFQGLTPETGGAVWARGFEMIQAVEDLPFPVVFAAHALTLTWGFELALACDLVVAARARSSDSWRSSSGSRRRWGARSGWPRRPARTGRRTSS